MALAPLPAATWECTADCTRVHRCANPVATAITPGQPTASREALPGIAAPVTTRPKVLQEHGTEAAIGRIQASNHRTKHTIDGTSE